MNAGDLCNREVICVEGGASIVEAARRMREHHVGDLVVTEPRGGVRVPVGTLTDRDIVVSLLARDVADLYSLRVSDVLVDDLITAEEGDSVADVVKRMRAHGVRRVPVVRDDGALCGIITFDDMVDLLATLLDDLAALVGRQITVERDLRG